MAGGRSFALPGFLCSSGLRRSTLRHGPFAFFSVWMREQMVDNLRRGVVRLSVYLDHGHSLKQGRLAEREYLQAYRYRSSIIAVL